MCLSAQLSTRQHNADRSKRASSRANLVQTCFGTRSVLHFTSSCARHAWSPLALRSIAKIVAAVPLACAVAIAVAGAAFVVVAVAVAVITCTILSIACDGRSSCMAHRSVSGRTPVELHGQLAPGRKSDHRGPKL